MYRAAVGWAVCFGVFGSIVGNSICVVSANHNFIVGGTSLAMEMSSPALNSYLIFRNLAGPNAAKVHTLGAMPVWFVCRLDVSLMYNIMAHYGTTTTTTTTMFTSVPRVCLLGCSRQIVQVSIKIFSFSFFVFRIVLYGSVVVLLCYILLQKVGISS